ncbi:MAG: aminoacyl-tRNA hydrolase [Spirochaetia bacterium]|jgi:PTH1 family peptidyl-tRNA hydrolase|nr:aminoacyl-tRNA hydrolase [Spirochaetia bacterium]
MKKSEKKEISDILLAFFCGNPGKEYISTRHNAGWMLLDELAKSENLSWQTKFKGSFARSVRNSGLIYLKPDIFMNLAGQSLSPAASFFKLSPENILVCHDDIELDYGTISLKFGGSCAGHNGLRSIEKMIGTRDFFRFRIGISRPSRGDVSSHVLGRFGRDEEIVLPLYMELAAAKFNELFSSTGTGKTLSDGKKIRLLP